MEKTHAAPEYCIYSDSYVNILEQVPILQHLIFCVPFASLFDLLSIPYIEAVANSILRPPPCPA